MITYTPIGMVGTFMLWGCDRCHGAVIDRDAHDEYHADEPTPMPPGEGVHAEPGVHTEVTLRCGRTIPLPQPVTLTCGGTIFVPDAYLESLG
jgi:hypothetical protein